MLNPLASIADQLSASGVHDRIAQLGVMLLSTAHAELQAAADSRSYDGALLRCRIVLAALFGEPQGRSFDVKFWDGSIDRREQSARAVHHGAQSAGFTPAYAPPPERAIYRRVLHQR